MTDHPDGIPEVDAVVQIDYSYPSGHVTTSGTVLSKSEDEDGRVTLAIGQGWLDDDPPHLFVETDGETAELHRGDDERFEVDRLRVVAEPE